MTWWIIYLLVGFFVAEIGNANMPGESMSAFEYLVGLFLWPIIVLYVVWKGFGG